MSYSYFFCRPYLCFSHFYYLNPRTHRQPRILEVISTLWIQHLPSINTTLMLLLWHSLSKSSVASYIPPVKLNFFSQLSKYSVISLCLCLFSFVWGPSASILCSSIASCVSYFPITAKLILFFNFHTFSGVLLSSKSSFTPYCTSH